MRLAARVAVRYGLFASISTLVNIASQMISMFLYRGSYAVELSILLGTLIALPLRFLLEKRYIFSYRSKDLRHDGQLFLLYSLMGVFTTIIFWGIEYTFHKLFESDGLRYVGGIIGLLIGFYIKYRLDKRFVFIKSECVGVIL